MRQLKRVVLVLCQVVRREGEEVRGAYEGPYAVQSQ
jgi:hypothetical protein